MIDLGGIITGSRALNFYNIKGVPIINRKPNDWDIILDKDSFYKFCNKYDINPEKASSNLYNDIFSPYYNNHNILCVTVVTGGKVASYSRLLNFSTGIYINRGSDYLFRQDFNITSFDELPTYIECGKYKISTLESIIDYKLNLIKNDIKRRVFLMDYKSKHLTDCLEIMVKLKANRNPRNAYELVLNTLGGYSDSKELINRLNNILKILKINENETISR